MKRYILTFIAGVIVIILLSLGLKRGIFTLPLSAQPASLTVSAAASLRESLQEIQSLYKQSKPNVKITYNLGASGSLQQQIEQGAPVDIFISAAAKQIDALQAKNLLLSGTRRNLLTNQMVLIASSNEQNLTNIKDLIRPQLKRIALGEPRSVPAGQYAAEILKYYGIFDQVKPKIIYAKDVRQVLTYVETGNVNAGFVYTTDAKNSNQVKIVTTAPASTHAPIVYPVAVLKSSKNLAVAKEFIQFLFSSQAKSVFTKYGFKMAS